MAPDTLTYLESADTKAAEVTGPELDGAQPVYRPELLDGTDGERITLVDLRYISAARLTDYADLSDATDVLYLCSTAVWNNGGTLRE